MSMFDRLPQDQKALGAVPRPSSNSKDQYGEPSFALSGYDRDTPEYKAL